jgi:ABC-type multidrug transport system fused ATPase/permease subunit
MKYFDLVPVGQLVTRSVSDIESIRIFSQGLFMIISDLMKMVVVLCFMFYMNWQLTWIVVVAMPVLVFITRIFQRKMVLRTGNQISNMNSFVQERVTGMKILQLFNRRKLNPKIQGNQRYKKSMDQNNSFTPIFFPLPILSPR